MSAKLLKFRPGMERLESREVPSGTPTEPETPTTPETPPAETETPTTPTEGETPSTPTDGETPSKPEAESGTPTTPTPTETPVTPTPPAPTTPVVTSTRQVSQTERFVTRLYQDVLGRQADAGGLAYWVTNLELGTFTQGQASIAFVTSDEYRTNTIRSYYQDILGRIPAQSEVDGYMGLFRAGQSQDQIRERFFASEEFFARFSQNPAAFVSQLYSQVLGRTGNTQEVSFWVNVLRTTNGDRTSIARSFLTSREYIEIQVGEVYTVFLDRLPDQAGFNYWVGRRTDGQTIEVVATGVLASAEYFWRNDAYPLPA